MLELFPKILPLKKILELQDWKKTAKKKENFKPEIKLMIENWQHELYQLEKKQAKRAKLIANMRWRWRGKNTPKLERQNMQNQTTFELDTDDNKAKYSSSPKE